MIFWKPRKNKFWRFPPKINYIFFISVEYSQPNNNYAFLESQFVSIFLKLDFLTILSHQHLEFSTFLFLTHDNFLHTPFKTLWRKNLNWNRSSTVKNSINWNGKKVREFIAFIIAIINLNKVHLIVLSFPRSIFFTLLLQIMKIFLEFYSKINWNKRSNERKRNPNVSTFYFKQQIARTLVQ